MPVRICTEGKVADLFWVMSSSYIFKDNGNILRVMRLELDFQLSGCLLPEEVVFQLFYYRINTKRDAIAVCEAYTHRTR